MITLDWKQRLIVDTEDFVNRKLPQNNYDIDIVYNAYPKRVDNKVPNEVINFVAKTLSARIGKNIDRHVGFLDYLWENKGEPGNLIFTHLMKTALAKKPELFVDYLIKRLTGCSDAAVVKSLLKTIMPLIKKEPKKYVDILCNMLTIHNPVLHKAIINLLLVIVKDDTAMMKYIFQKMERGWLYPSPYTINNSTLYLKAIYKINPEFYFNVYDNYKGSRNPVFVEILCNALNPIQEDEYYDKVFEILTNWSKSGNVRIKKAALAGLKIMKRAKKKVKTTKHI